MWTLNLPKKAGNVADPADKKRVEDAWMNLVSPQRRDWKKPVALEEEGRQPYPWPWYLHPVVPSFTPSPCPPQFEHGQQSHLSIP